MLHYTKIWGLSREFPKGLCVFSRFAIKFPQENPMTKAFQDYYPENFAHCYGCGHRNERGHQFKTYWDGEESVTRYTPEPHHTSVPGFVYGGLLAALIDCHSTGTAAAALYRAAGREMDTLPALRCVTASLHVDYLKPTPLNVELEVRGRVKEVKGRKVIVESTVYANGVATVRGEVVAVQIPEDFQF
jgi:acyl-coenzyme A thioesterase PaaI-like protein